MQLTLLGTGPASPLPRIYCTCKTCADARRSNSRSRRSRSSALLAVGDKRILFDATPDVLAQLERTRAFVVDAIFFTHAHNDAMGGFFDLQDLLRKQKHPATLYLESGTYRRLLHDLGGTEPWMTIEKISAGQTLRVHGVEIIPFRVEHSAQPGFPTLGYRIGKDLVYGSDIKSVPESSERFIRGARHAVLDGCFWFGTKFPTHLTVDETIALADRLRVRNLYLTQISHNYPPHALAQGLIAEYVKQQKITTRVTLAYDGISIQITHK